MRLIASFLLIFMNCAHAESCDSVWKKLISNSSGIDLDDAIKNWKKVEKDCKSDPDYYTNLGTLQVMSGDLASGENSYLKGIELNPNNDYGYAQLAGLRLAQGNLQEVVKQCNISLKIRPNYTCFRHSAIAYASLDKPKQATDAFGSAYEQNPNALADVDLMTSVAIAYADQKKWELARNSLAVLMQKNPSAEQSKNFSIALNYIKKAMAENGVTSIK